MISIYHTQKNRSFKQLHLIIWSVLIITSVLTLSLGDTPWERVWNHVQLRLSGLSDTWNPLLDERLPRLIVILCTGASLAIAGAVMQSLFHNPLASPNILGISCGGALCVVFIFIAGWHMQFPFAIPIAAFTGSLMTLLFVYAICKTDGQVELNSLLLTGIAISSLFIAIQASIMYAIRDNWLLVQTLTEWEGGTTMDRSWSHVHMQLPLTLIGIYGCWHYRSEIDILALGEEEARNLGVQVEKVRWRLFLCVAMLTGGAIASVGIIAFFGLVLPHFVRYIQGPASHHLIPLCILLGSTSFAVMDLLLRVLEVRALSIGNVSAILGGIAFLLLVRRSHRLFFGGSLRWNKS